MEKKIIFSVDFDTKNAKKNVIELEKELIDLKNQQKVLSDAYKQGLISQDAYLQGNLELNESIKKVKTEQKSYQYELDLSTKANLANLNSYNEISAAYSLQSKRLREMADSLTIAEDGTIELTEEYKKQSEAVKQLKDAMIAFDKGISDGRSSVGLYSDALNEFGENLKSTLNPSELLGKSFDEIGKTLSTTFANGLKLVSQGLQILKANIIATGIGALIIAFGALVAMFLSTEKGMNKLNAVFAGLKQIIAPVINLILGLGEAAFSAIEKVSDLAGAFTDTFLGTNYAGAKKLTTELQKQELVMAQMEARSAKSLATQEELKNLRDSEGLNDKERLEYNMKAWELEKARIKDVVTERQKELDKLKEKRNLTNENQRTQEEEIKILTKKKEIDDAITDSRGKQNEYITEALGIMKDMAQVAIDIRTAELETDILRGKVKKGSLEELNVRKQVAKEKLNINLKEFQQGEYLQKLGNDFGKLSEKEKLERIVNTFDKAKVFQKQALQEEAQLQFDFNEEQKEKNQELMDKMYAQQLASLQLRVDSSKKGSLEEYKAREQFAIQSAKIEIAQNKLVGNERALREQQAQNELRDIRLEYQQLQNSDLEAALQYQIILADENSQEYITKQKELLALQAKNRIDTEVLTTNQIKQINAETLKAQEDLQKQFDDKIKAQKYANADALNNLAQQTQKNEQIAQQRAFEAELQMLGNNFTQKEKLTKDYYEAQKNLARANFEGQIALENEMFRREMENTQLSNTEKETLKTNHEARINQIFFDYTSQGYEIQKTNTEAVKQLNELRVQSELDTATAIGDILGQTAGLLKENTIAFKLLASAQAIINTYAAAMSAYAAAAKIDPFILAPIAAGIATATGLANVAKINEVEFARGGLVEGASHANGGVKFAVGGRVVELEGGEAVINKKSTAMFAGELSAINQAGGGVKFADGGTTAGGYANRILQANMSNMAMIDMAKALPAPMLSITELDKVQRSVKIAENLYNIS